MSKPAMYTNSEGVNAPLLVLLMLVLKLKLGVSAPLLLLLLIVLLLKLKFGGNAPLLLPLLLLLADEDALNGAAAAGAAAAAAAGAMVVIVVGAAPTHRTSPKAESRRLTLIETPLWSMLTLWLPTLHASIAGLAREAQGTGDVCCSDATRTSSACTAL